MHQQHSYNLRTITAANVRLEDVSSLAPTLCPYAVHLDLHGRHSAAQSIGTLRSARCI